MDNHSIFLQFIHQMLFLFPPFVILGRSGEEHIATGVEGGLHAILDDADDETDCNGLHRHIIADAEERTGHGYQQ